MILVTGATGTTGSVVLRALIERGADVRALTHTPEHAEALEQAGLDVVLADLDDPGSLAPALRGVERMYLAQTANERQAAQEINAISAAEQAGVYHVVKLGFRTQDTASPVRFARAHAESTEQLQQSSLRWTILEPGGFFQNVLGQAESIAQGRLVSPHPDAKAALVDARDVGEIAARALAEEGHEGATYTLTGPEALSDSDISHALGVICFEVGDDDVRRALGAAGFPDWNVEGFLELADTYRSGALAGVTGDAEALLGRPPRSFAQFVQDHGASFGR
jgi:uncharacterized protein YbjT (DUF2867 family)